MMGRFYRQLVSGVCRECVVVCRNPGGAQVGFNACLNCLAHLILEKCDAGYPRWEPARQSNKHCAC